MVVPGGVAADAVSRRAGAPFRGWFCEQSRAFSSRRGAANLVTPAWRAVSCMVLWAIYCVFFRTGGPPTLLRRPGVPFRKWFCKQSLAFSSGRGGRQLGYAGLACRFVCGVVGNLLRFPPDGGPANLVTLAWRAVSCVVLSAISSLAELFQAHFWCAWGRGTRCTGGAGLGAPGAR